MEYPHFVQKSIFNRKYIFHPGPFFSAILVYRSVSCLKMAWNILHQTSGFHAFQGLLHQPEDWARDENFLDKPSS